MIDSRDQFRMGFVLVLALVYASLFYAMISGFAVALLLAAIFSAIAYPLYTWLHFLRS